MRDTNCAVCGIVFTPQVSRQKYCGNACRVIGKARCNAELNRKRGLREYAEAKEALVKLQRKPQPQRSFERAASLAECDDVPAQTAGRDDMLTGKAGAKSHAVSMGMVGVAI